MLSTLFANKMTKYFVDIMTLWVVKTFVFKIATTLRHLCRQNRYYVDINRLVPKMPRNCCRHMSRTRKCDMAIKLQKGTSCQILGLKKLPYTWQKWLWFRINNHIKINLLQNCQSNLQNEKTDNYKTLEQLLAVKLMGIWFDWKSCGLVTKIATI